MSNKSPAYRWYPRDILGSLRVAAMTAAEECWYRRALDFAWLNHGVPCDPVKLSRIIGKKCTAKGAQIVLTMFTPSSDNPGVCVSERQEAERLKQKEWSEKSANGGRRSRPPEQPKEGTKDEPPLEANDKQKGTLQFTSEGDSPTEESEEVPQAATAPNRRRGTRLPDEFFLTAEMKAWANENRPGVDLALETKKFCNHFRSAPGQKGVKLDWGMTWQNWILNARAENGTNRQHRSGQGKRTDQDVIAESVEFYEQHFS